jgi:hypothetical protein
MSADEWIPCDQRPPVKEDYGDSFHSEEVLFTDGKRRWSGYLQTWADEEYEPTWKMAGPDGYNVENVTHWMPLPELPRVVAEGSPANSADIHRVASEIRRTAGRLAALNLPGPGYLSPSYTALKQSQELKRLADRVEKHLQP